jgi:hypothetical protein
VLYGNIARVGCRIPSFGPYPFDQLNCGALPGSSGGMVTLRQGENTGQWVGMITLGLRGSDNFHWTVPLRIVRDWAKEVKVEWLLKPNGKTMKADLEKVPLENNKAGFARTFKAQATSEISEYYRPMRTNVTVTIRGPSGPT